MTQPRAHRVTPTLRPNGCDLDVEGFVQQTLVDLIALLADRDHPEFMDDLDRVLTSTAAPDPFHPERDLPTEDLVARLSALLPTSIRLHRPEAVALANQLAAIAAGQARRPLGSVPEQPGRGAA